MRKETGWEPSTLSQFTTETNFDVLDINNELYKYNSTEGGAILPRGTSLIGLDLRKTKIRPLYVPDPEYDDKLYSSVLRVTGTCYFTAFTIFDADISKPAYYDYDSNTKTPTFSHHKLATFAYADGLNNVLINGSDSGLTDLDMYYFKVARAYGDSSGRPLGDYPTFDDFEPNVDEFRIVGDISLTLLVSPLSRLVMVIHQVRSLLLILVNHMVYSKILLFLLLVLLLVSILTMDLSSLTK